MNHLQKIAKLSKTKMLKLRSVIWLYQFPSISRFITEVRDMRIAVGSKIFIVNFLCGFLLMGIGIVLWDTNESYATLIKVKGEREEVVREYAYWQNIIKTYPDYRDGYLKLATLATQLGEKNQGEEYLRKVYELDPNFEGIEK